MNKYISKQAARAMVTQYDSPITLYYVKAPHYYDLEDDELCTDECELVKFVAIGESPSRYFIKKGSVINILNPNDSMLHAEKESLRKNSPNIFHNINDVINFYQEIADDTRDALHTIKRMVKNNG